MLLQAHPTGNSFVSNLAQGLVTDDLLSEFWTCLDYPTRDRWLGMLPSSWLREAKRRQIPDSVKPHSHLLPSRELARLFGHRLGLGRWISGETHPLSVDGIYRNLDQRVARRLKQSSDFRGVYLYEDGADQGFKAARAKGLHTFYDLPIGYWRSARRILKEEAQLSPEWAATLSGNQDSESKLAQKDRELEMADTVFVASKFTQNTLAEAPTPPKDTVLVPYGSPTVNPDARPAARKRGEPLRVLYVGSLGQRKGLRYLLEAMGSLGSEFELTLIGHPPPVKCAPLASAIQIHRHVASMPHANILEEMRQHHVLVFPSLFEGFGLVLTEALACGLPIIATPHTAAPDLITEGKEGYIVPIRSSDHISQKLTTLAENESQRREMGERAITCAKRHTWKVYQQTMARQIRQRLSQS